ncbi:MAG TPA: aconitase/3-isopropylmalate dehydratase large subunit family protein [Xenococcaceae cyanobacterium]|jgi:homoaconitate hydratase family protein
MNQSAKILFLGDDINTDDIIPAKRGTNGAKEHLAYYALEHIIGAGKLQEYDVIEAGHNFGCGSSREYAPLAIQAAGIKQVCARSFAEIFYRNSINIGLDLAIIGETQDNLIIRAIAAAGGLIPFNQQRLKNQITLPPSNTARRPMTMAEKMLARASGNQYVQPGEVIFINVDLAMSHDAIASEVARLFYQHFGANNSVWDASRVVLVADHFIQINDIRKDARAIEMYQKMVQFAQEQNCHLFDVVSPGEAAGICHVLLPEKGLVRPGMIIAGTDSHSCTYGAFGAFSTGVGTTDMANILATGSMWLRVPSTILLELSGTLPEHLSAKDIMLFILGQIGCNGATGKVIEFCGAIIQRLALDERMTLANMAVECGAMCGLIAPDRTTLEYVTSRTSKDFTIVTGDANAEYERIYRFDLSHLESQIACPPKPDRVVTISQLGDVTINKAFIGSCTGGKLHDLAEAAKILHGKKIATGVNLFIVPASGEIQQKAQELGYLDTLEQAGAQILKSGCGACINAGIGVLASEEVGIYATNRNFKGRSGDPTAQNYLASPRVVAISALRGKISDRL